MQQHAVPQNVTSFEFKIVGSLTLKQFGMLGTCGVFAFITYLAVENIVAKVAFILLFVGLGILLAFGSVQNIPFYRWIFIFIQAIFSPTQRIWIKTATAPNYMTAINQTVDITQTKRVIEDRTVLSSYLQTLPNQKRTSLDVLENQKLQSLSLNRPTTTRTETVQAQPSLSNTPAVKKADPPTVPAPAPIKNETPIPSTPQSSPFDSKPSTNQSIKSDSTPQVVKPTITLPPTSLPTTPQINATTNPIAKPSGPIQPNISPTPISPPKISAEPSPKPAAMPIVAQPAAPSISVPPVVPIKTEPPAPAKPAPSIPTIIPRTPPAPTATPIEPKPELKPEPKSEPKSDPKLEPKPVPTESPVQSPPKFWSTIQGIEREFIQELRQMREADEKEKNELKARLAEIERKQQDLEKQKESELKQKESELSAQKIAEIKLLQEQFDKQKLEIESKQSEKTKEEAKFLQEMQQKLNEEKAKRELFEKNNAEINAQMKSLLEEKAAVEANLSLKNAATVPNSSENEQMKQQVHDLNAKIEKLNAEIAQRTEQEKQRKTQESEKLKEELAAQKAALENEKLLMANEKAQLQNERTAIQQQNQELEAQKKKLQEIELQLTKRQAEIEAASKKSSEQQQQRNDSLDQLASTLQKEAELLAPSKKPEGIAKSENLIVPKAEKPVGVKPISKTKTDTIITDLEPANIPQITNLVNVINGVVYDANGNLVPNVIIIVKDTEKTPVRALKSNRLGQFAISTPLPNGVYTMEFEDSKEERTFNMYQITLGGSVIPPIAIKERT